MIVDVMLGILASRALFFNAKYLVSTIVERPPQQVKTMQHQREPKDLYWNFKYMKIADLDIDKDDLPYIFSRMDGKTKSTKLRALRATSWLQHAHKTGYHANVRETLSLRT